jgi:hypothetical protein
MSGQTLEQKAARLMAHALEQIKKGEQRQEELERGSLRHSHYEGQEYAWQYVAETLAEFSPELGQKFGQKTAELWPEYPGGRL